MGAAQTTLRVLAENQTVTGNSRSPWSYAYRQRSIALALERQSGARRGWRRRDPEALGDIGHRG